MNMHMWNLSRRNPPAAGWGINRVQLSIKDEESRSMEGIVQRRWRVTTAEGWLHLGPPAGGRCETPEAGGSNKFFFLSLEDTFRSVVGGPAGAKVEAAHFTYRSLSA